MAYFPMQRIYEKNSNIYKSVLLASKRALELSGGATPLVPKDESGKTTTIALREIAEGRIYVVEEKEKEKPKAKKAKK